jgi:hypothetical protein
VRHGRVPGLLAGLVLVAMTSAALAADVSTSGAASGRRSTSARSARQSSASATSPLQPLARLPRAPIVEPSPLAPGSLAPLAPLRAGTAPGSRQRHPHRLSKAALRRVHRAARAEERARRRWLASRHARAERRRSRTRYTRLGSASAVAVIRDAAPQVAVQPAWQPPSLMPGERIDAYVGSNVARIDVPGSSVDTLMVSSTPLVIPDAAGDLAPVDTTLTAVGDGWRPANTTAKLSIGQRIADGITLGDAPQRLVVRAGGNGNTRGQLVGGKVFFPNADVDTDTIVEATSTGVSVAWAVRSPAAPESERLQFDLPADVTLRAVGQDVVLARGSLTVGTISAPVATDAQGTPVPVQYVLTGPNTVEVRMAHRKRDIAYPVAIDPVVDYYGVPVLLDPDGSGPLTRGWWPSANGGNVWASAPDQPPFQLAASSGGWGYSWFAYTAPRASFITRAEFQGATHYNPGGATIVHAGLYLLERQSLGGDRLGDVLQRELLWLEL